MRLFTPGPVQIPRLILEAFVEPAIHHRTSSFKSIFKETQILYQVLVGSTELPVFLAGSGTAAMEAALANICTRDDLVLCVNVGKFGERWRHICKACRIPFAEIKKEPGYGITLNELLSACKEISPSVVCLQHCETSTGVLLNLPDLLLPLKKRFNGIITVVDAVSTVGAEIICQKREGIDVLVGACQKGLMLPPGLSMLSFSSKAKEKILSNAECPSFYLNLKTEIMRQEKSSTAWTTATHHIKALNCALKYIKQEGISQINGNLKEKALWFREELKQLGFKPFVSHNASPSCCLTVAIPPSHIDAETLRSKLYKEHGFVIAAGQGELKGRIVRIAHFGDNSMDNFKELAYAIKRCLTN